MWSRSGLALISILAGAGTARSNQTECVSSREPFDLAAEGRCID